MNKISLELNGRYKGALYNSGLMLKNSRRRLILYDKAAEMQSRGAQIPSNYKGYNLLRYEVQLRQKLHEYDGLSELAIPDLLNPEVLNRIRAIWKKYYKEFKFIKTPSMPKIQTKGDCRRYLEQEGLTTVGVDYLLKQIQNLKTEKKREYHRIKNHIKRLIQAENNLDTQQNHQAELMGLVHKYSQTIQ